MDIFQAALFGIVQGLTEFLPVSSSGHLVLIQKLIPLFSQPGILFDVLLHFGTLFAVIFFFGKEIYKLSVKYLSFLVIGTIPAVVAGIFFKDAFEQMFSTGKYLWLEFMITGVINILIDIPFKIKSKLNLKNSFIIGIFQAIAIIPAISRSGATIFSGSFLGIDKKEVAKYSFLLSVPAVFGANLLELKDNYGALNSINITNYLIGFVVAFVVGVIAIKAVYKLLEKNQFKYFGFYCLVLGIIALFIIK